MIDPEHPDFIKSLALFGEMTGQDTHSWQGYLQAHRNRRADFIAMGATSSDHGHPTPEPPIFLMLTVKGCLTASLRAKLAQKMPNYSEHRC